MKLIGDPHLGREFRAYVPLDRIGDREAMMLTEFESQINESDDTTVVVGDLFERPIVATGTLYKTLNIIIDAALARPNRKIIIMAGNHDLDKAIERRGSFHLLAVALERVPNIHVLFVPTVIDNVAYFPWQYEKTAQEQVLELFNSRDHTPPIAVGHWDLESFGDDIRHLCPAKSLRSWGVQTIYSGHWHLAGDYVVDGIDVVCTGSMQPMTHAEDKTGGLYITLTPEDYRKIDPATLANKYVRVRGTTNDPIDPPDTCLGFKVEVVAEEKEIERVNMGAFDMDDILKQAFTSFEVKKDVQLYIKESLNASS